MTASQAESAASWVPTDVIAHAKELILSSNYEKVPEARKNVDEILAQWVQVVEKATDDEKERGIAAIVELWGAYAALEVELRQFKQATKVFESAVSCPVASTHVVLWLQYATFCIDRQKFSNARKVFVRALRTVPDHEHSPLWQQFHAFVVEHMDPNMTMPALQAQIFPDRPAVPVEATPAPPKAAAINNVAAASAPTPDAAVVSAAAAPVANVAPTPVVEKPVPAVDPNLAFVDTKGSAYASASVNGDAGPKKRAAEAQSSSTDAKRNRHGTVPIDGESQYFTHVPTTLPVTPECPHLLFDADGSRREVDNQLLERLSDVLGDSAVFQGVRDLHDNQRQRDRDMLFRWQDLVGMQMKEGSELFARHADVERNVIEPRDLIDLKTKHLEQRREFVHRCQMSQQQFIEICEMDRVGALRAQQISLENMKIPEMTVSMDPDVIGLQRAILNLILEAERLWREENAKPAPTATPKQQTPTKSAAPVSEKTSNISSRPRSDSRDRAAMIIPHLGTTTRLIRIVGVRNSHVMDRQDQDMTTAAVIDQIFIVLISATDIKTIDTLCIVNLQIGSTNHDTVARRLCKLGASRLIHVSMRSHHIVVPARSMVGEAVMENRNIMVVHLMVAVATVALLRVDTVVSL
ncbi:hypothetical protein Poli38472_004785 [Pythium oligandrum]|uniref:Pre-mRNA-splicing factor Syf1-like N-terminal HAT-repeats domain-containing protein n=1 Tax=Pythium oligandrum TaxID=41045 RepID=A0A8K1FER5_PYTOL|nr:hypothetical protein Poli38472_004785 [Pythium oligandrum]|eukprot:TMW59716.1 hypothetical protein Poli38472_004785 [Pythium oligandrum]